MAALINDRGHSVRIAIAGHDASVLARYPAEATPVFTVQRNSVYPSHVALPMKVRDSALGGSIGLTPQQI